MLSDRRFDYAKCTKITMLLALLSHCHPFYTFQTSKTVLEDISYTTAKVSDTLYKEIIELSKYRFNYPLHGAYHFE
jgi:hypothetical protein